MNPRDSVRVGTILRVKSAPRGFCRLSHHSGGIVVIGDIIRCSLGHGHRFCHSSELGSGSGTLLRVGKCMEASVTRSPVFEYLDCSV